VPYHKSKDLLDKPSINKTQYRHSHSLVAIIKLALDRTHKYGIQKLLILRDANTLGIKQTQPNTVPSNIFSVVVLLHANTAAVFRNSMLNNIYAILISRENLYILCSSYRRALQLYAGWQEESTIQIWAIWYFRFQIPSAHLCEGNML